MSDSDVPDTPAPLQPDQFKHLADLSLDILTISGADGRFTWVNAAAEQVLGWSFEELTTRPYFELLHPDDVERTQLALGGVMNGETVLDFENRYLHKDGSYRWLSWRCGPISPDGVLVATARDVTEYRSLREAAQEVSGSSQELAEREAQLRAAEREGAFGSWTWNPSNNEVRWSPSLYGLLGLEESEAASFERYFELVHPDDVERVAASAAAGSEAGELPPQRYRIIRANDGAVRVIQATAGTAILNEAGEISTMAGALLDVTEQVEAELALRLSESQLREAQAMANVGHWSWDFSSQRSQWSDQMYRIWNAEPGEELNSEAFYEHMHGDDRARVRQAARAAMEGEEAFECAFRVAQLRTGNIRHVHMAARPDRGTDGAVRGYVGIIHDVTERQEAKEALLRNEWVLREAQQVAGIGSWTFDPADGRVTWSEEMYRICGIPRDREAAMALHLDLVHPDDRPALEAAGLQQPIADIPSIDYRIQRLTDGESRHVSTATHVLCNDDGEPLLVIGTTMDVTDERRLAEELRQAQKMEAVGQLAGGVAHDFNNSLTAILGNAELAKLSLPGHVGDAADSIDAVIDAAEQAADVTRQLLAFARRQIVQPAVLDPAERLLAIARLLRPMLGEQIAVDVHAEPDDARIRMDPGQLEQLLMNLAVNARDAMPEGGTLGIACSRVSLGAGHAARSEGVGAGEYVLIAVSDTGIGMDAKTREHIFEPFYTTKESGRGTGLGLATCHGIVMQNRGHIFVDSEPNAGTTFRLFFPHVEGASTPGGRQSAGNHDSTSGTERVLLVEDEASVRAMCATALRRLGYHVTDVADGAGAIDAAIEAARTAAPFQMLFTDVVLPDMRGPEVARRVREHQPAVVVLFASGYTEDEIVRDGEVEADVNFLPKPYTPSRMARAVRDLLDKG